MAKLVTVDEIVHLLTEAREELTTNRRFIMMVGPQGAGKSTIAKAIKKRGYKRLSYDRLAKRNPFVNDNWLERHYCRWLDKCLAQKLDIVDDNLNTDRARRKRTIDKVKRAGYSDIVMVHLDMPLALCVEQNGRRERQVPQWIVEKAWQTFQKEGLPLSSEAPLMVRIAVSSSGEPNLFEYEATPSTDYDATVPQTESEFPLAAWRFLVSPRAIWRWLKGACKRS